MDTARAKVNVIENELVEMGNLSRIFDRQITDTQDKYNMDSMLDRVDGILKDQKLLDDASLVQPFQFDASALDSFHLDLTIPATNKAEANLEEKSVGTSPSLAAANQKDAAVSPYAETGPVPSQEKPARDVSNIRTEIQEQKSFNLAWLDESQLRNVKKAALDAKKKPVAAVKAPVSRPKSAAPSVLSRISSQLVRSFCNDGF